MMGAIKDLDLVEARARAATQAEWSLGIIGGDGTAAVTVAMPFGKERMICLVCEIDHREADRVHVPALSSAEDDAAHIATMDPPTTLALVAEVRRLREEAVAIRDALHQACADIRFCAGKAMIARRDGDDDDEDEDRLLRIADRIDAIRGLP